MTSSRIVSRSALTPCSASSACRRRARLSSVAVRKNFTSASGHTMVPVSRPSSTTPPGSAARRCSGVTLSRTSRRIERVEVASATAWLRISRVTSSPFSFTWPCSMVTSSGARCRASAAVSSSEIPARSTLSASARYMAPVGISS